MIPQRREFALSRRLLQAGVEFQVSAVQFIAGQVAGHGHGAPIKDSVWFGLAAFAWPVAPSFQYAFYAYVALRRLRALGWLLALVHYGGALAVLFFQNTKGALDLYVHAKQWPELLWMFGPFMCFNVVYFRRLLRR